MFNIDNGYLEGLCRGFKNGILRQADYLNLVQCETLEDLKLHLQARMFKTRTIFKIKIEELSNNVLCTLSFSANNLYTFPCLFICVVLVLSSAFVITGGML
jgi:ATP synthase (C/AC39) subunit